MKLWRNPLETQTSVQTSQLFSTLDQSFEKKLLIFLVFGSVEVSVHNFVLGPCAILKLQTFGHPRSNITTICRGVTIHEECWYLLILMLLSVKRETPVIVENSYTVGSRI